MTDEQLRSHIERLRSFGSDDAQVEVKAAGGGIPKSFWDSVSAFANTSGGHILLGLDESRGFRIAEGFNAKKISDAVITGFDDRDSKHAKVSPTPPFDTGVMEFEGSHIVWVRVEALDPAVGKSGPCFVVAKGLTSGSFKRIGDADKRLSPYEIYTMQSAAGKDRSDREIVEGTSLESLDESLVRRTIENLRSGHSRALEGVDTEDLSRALKRINVLAPDGQTTMAGYLTLSEYPQQEFPQLVIDVAAHPRTEKSAEASVRFLDRQVCDGPVPVAIRDAVYAVKRNLTTVRKVNGVDGENLTEIPEEVIREAITNAVMHRDYSHHVTGQQVNVDIYPDRVEVSNPGGFWGDRTKENVTEGHSASRNEVLARLLTDVPLPGSMHTVSENQGSGVVRMVEAMMKQGLPVPDYSDSDIARVTVKLARFGLLNPDTASWIDSLPDADSLVHDERIALALARANGGLTVRDLRLNAGLDSDDGRRVIGALVARGLLMGSGDGPYTLASISESPRVSGVKWEILGVLGAGGELSVREIAEKTGRPVGSLRPMLRELVEAGLAVPTAPPQSKKRKYRLPQN